ncbi:GTPase HflX [Chengkuizengella axinellae]|uniref:GTPase HflX n=1 Tax=Chengkuizengella axinellae TaxID=3064388 RepID=A0ABT9IX88_9BACL|nr:GTPase HflX [Chengkuizengella sp. 2205SS18-9]MDP5273985.1 GTPase HflX [Chengkuizengella sp. 2205SS18-9]
MSTHQVKDKDQEKVLLVSLILQDAKQLKLEEYSLNELVLLAETAGLQVLDSIKQHRKNIDSKWFIGKGKAEEIKEKVAELEVDTVIFNQELSGAQVRNLELFLDAKIIDRTQLILDIFAGRANTREGYLQVELAQLSYLLPRLSGHGKNLSRLGGGIGTRGPGETKLEMNRRHIRDRITDLKKKLQEVTRHRNLHRMRRKKTNLYHVALVGYTNAGKSTLLKQLTGGANIYVENQLFATLDPTLRTLKLPSGKEVGLTDTVGFIQDLPHDLVAAFSATLEEVREADLILHVVDSTSELIEEQINVVDEVLHNLGVQGKETIMVYNKKDICDRPQSKMIFPNNEDHLFVSAFEDHDLQQIKLAIQNKLLDEQRTFTIPVKEGKLISFIKKVSETVEEKLHEDNMSLTVRINAHDVELINKEMRKLGE